MYASRLVRFGCFALLCPARVSNSVWLRSCSLLNGGVLEAATSNLPQMGLLSNWIAAVEGTVCILLAPCIAK
jgi:hypothetical protein